MYKVNILNHPHTHLKNMLTCVPANYNYNKSNYKNVKIKSECFINMYFLSIKI